MSIGKKVDLKLPGTGRGERICDGKVWELDVGACTYDPSPPEAGGDYNFESSLGYIASFRLSQKPNQVLDSPRGVVV